MNANGISLKKFKKLKINWLLTINDVDWLNINTYYNNSIHKNLKLSRSLNLSTIDEILDDDEFLAKHLTKDYKSREFSDLKDITDDEDEDEDDEDEDEDEDEDDEDDEESLEFIDLKDEDKYEDKYENKYENKYEDEDKNLIKYEDEYKDLIKYEDKDDEDEDDD